MADDNLDYRYVDMLGRVVALEQAIRFLMTAYAGERNLDPERLRDTMFKGFQRAERSIGPGDDEVWSAAVAALEKLFADVAKRLSEKG
ncbi:hypothetical protein GJ689_24965 [Rhodoplanes serenus]|uniref:Uncharacterized protein n=1 Tax=Rhodoplanes serenus TaxID=200615 RepID=A0A9X4XRD7_9BRAD|nr:hypothetical protein [Rhodoplanes serenus]MTW19447.1 hypothetical protein [Rhodoplanes serenus]